MPNSEAHVACRVLKIAVGGQDLQVMMEAQAHQRGAQVRAVYGVPSFSVSPTRPARSMLAMP